MVGAHVGRSGGRGGCSTDDSRVRVDTKGVPRASAVRHGERTRRRRSNGVVRQHHARIRDRYNISTPVPDRQRLLSLGRSVQRQQITSPVGVGQ